MDSISQGSNGEPGSRQGEEGKERVSHEQLAHFIEVGFNLDQKNFKHLDTYKESTFDSKITKHLFEL